MPKYFGVFLRITNTTLWLKYLAFLIMLVLTQACQYIGDQALNISKHDTDPINTRFNINQSDIQLINGYAEQIAAPDSSSKITTQVWGEPKVTDLNADGQQDAVLILSQNTGGSGTFYYLAVAIREGNHYKGSKGILLGDRIQPQEIQVVTNRVTVEFLERFMSEPTVTSPSMPREQVVIYDTDTQQLIPVEQNFEGEADPAVMTLGMKTWYWKETQYNNDSVLKPKSPKKFNLKFATNGKLLISTDCNTMGGEYSIADKRIAVSNMLSTRMFCKDSQEQTFAKMLSSVSSYFFTSKGQLVLELKYDSGTMIFW
ncbi:META domain-containing protein [uncultured Paraglaciecola sp.]|uniref:META domain-containing protein n=1 Tax=uncultured Paraglaciecola sp. TaxID=1765024 RepID=UPI0030DCD9DC|tara:strand:- start:27483 stop:28424 length:942 start_codon:yes stop_codon:yes gene_type:complete